MVEGHIVFNVFMYGLVIAYILYINFATYYNSGTKFLNFLIKLFNNWVFRLIFLLIVGFFALDLFPYGGFIFAVLLTIAFLNTNMLVYKKEISETFLDGNTGKDEYVRNDGNIMEPMTNERDYRKEKLNIELRNFENTKNYYENTDPEKLSDDERKNFLENRQRFLENSQRFLEDIYNRYKK